MLYGMFKTGLNIITAENGSVMHGLKNGEDGFLDFGEVYFSTVYPGALKAWKMHQKMTLNLVVPVGKVLFCFLDVRDQSETLNETFKIVLSQDPYFRLTIPPGIWFGFKGLDAGLNLVANVADIPHDPDEVLRKEIGEIEMDWSLE